MADNKGKALGNVSGKGKRIRKNMLKNDFHFHMFQTNTVTGKRGLSFMSKILGVIVLPAIIISVIITVYAIVTLQMALGGGSRDGLISIAKCVAAGYNTADESNYYVSNNDHLFKGFYDVTGREDVIDSYAADEDLDVSIYYGNICKATSMKDASTGERLLETEAPEDVVATVIDKGEIYSANNVKMNGHNYSVVYIPIVEDENVVGMVCAARFQNTVYKDVNRNRIGFIICEVVMIILLAMVSFTFAYRIARLIAFTGGAIDTMASGDLTFELDKKYLNRTDEIGNMLNQLNGLRKRFIDVISGVVKSAHTMYEASEEVGSMTSQTGKAMDDISNAVTELSNSAMGQADEVESANMSMMTLGDQVDDISEGVKSLDVSADNMKLASDKVIAIMDELSETTDRTTKAIESIGNQVMMTNKSVEEIKSAVAMITEIASETNLLSLNASIEAARAGESGRGFAVVASEIQKLSDQSNNSAITIGDIISELGRKSEDTVREMQVVEDIIKEQQEKLNETKEKFSAVESEIDSSRNETMSIKESTDVCNESKVKIVSVMSNLSALSEQNAASTEETTASIEEINANINVLATNAVKVNKLAEELVEAVKYFKLEN